GFGARLPSPPSWLRLPAFCYPNPCPASELPFPLLSLRSLPQLQLSWSREGMWRRSRMSAEAWVRSLARIYSTSAKFRDWELRLLMSMSAVGGKADIPHICSDVR